MTKILNLNSVVGDAARRLLTALGEDVELITVLSPVAPQIQADSAQIEQVIIELAMNACAGMPRGGKLTLETGNVVLGAPVAHKVAVVPGRYALLSVSDTGMGMDYPTRAHVLRPMPNTNAARRGASVEMASAQRFVKNSGGFIWTYIDLGLGTTFKIYLPQPTPAAQDPECRERLQTALPRGRETVLLVEDSAALREVNTELLKSLGYDVIPAADGEEALELADRDSRKIHLLLTDVVMPRISGKELAERLAIRRPEMRVLYMSGYGDNIVIQNGILPPNTAFLQKPFGCEELANKLREVLEPEPRS